MDKFPIGRQPARSVGTCDEFEDLLGYLTGFEIALSSRLRSDVENLVANLGASPPAPFERIAARFYGKINRKLDANRESRGELFATAAAQGRTFNYHQKRAISQVIDECDIDGLGDVLKQYGIRTPLLESMMEVRPVLPDDTKRLLRDETTKPSKLRKALARQVAEDVHFSCAGPLVWSLWDEAALYKHFGGSGSGDTVTAYLEYLRDIEPALFDRSRTLVIRYVDPRTRGEGIEGFVAREYDRIANHGYLAVIVAVDRSDPGAAWSLVHDATIFAERFQEVPLHQMFFRWKEIAAETIQYVPGVDERAARFDLISEGFTYRDIFVLPDKSRRICRLVLVLQKNSRDETPIPCPACRTSEIEGNSYPTLGVRSWECRNSLCPDRSIYNRGKRYQFKSIIAQAAIENPENDISPDSVRRWLRDVVDFVSDDEIIGTIISHYSMAGDHVALIDPPVGTNVVSRGRTINVEQAETAPPAMEFYSSSFFHRFRAVDTIMPTSSEPVNLDGSEVHLAKEGRYSLVEGEAATVLSRLPSNIFDRAITSPPYFNAREYSQWPNLYCYLHDMLIVAGEVFRTLRPGGLYAYNVFDYFDNDRTVTYSAMGKRRLPLGAFMADVFRRVGFVLVDNIAWDKGDIHGKRGYNAGNFSPFYQSPFNCWEHVLVAKKPDDKSTQSPPEIGEEIKCSVAKIRPVFKMVRGVNRHGHTAPFPEELPALLLNGLNEGALVLDPFAGSGTTARAALRKGLNALLIERDPEYCQLARKLTDQCISLLDARLW